MERQEQPGGEQAGPEGDDAAARADRRWALRRGIELTADVTDSTGFAFAARVIEISEEGCRLRTSAVPELNRDLVHQIKVTGLEPVDAYVVWTNGDDVGLTFGAPLDPVTVRSLVTKSLYARLSRRMARSAQGLDELPPLPPFPFSD
ncbi:PilZ domain-containing protein [Erythrobacter oryzae]|uniref:PilZ domain-containing protein n=1 Tax=Erythrobacter oryzae TaxID=3019556 RepID=UPI0025538F33|nr:PilZ domain-containing protein [Erythrobacter sp. COR-2]